MKTEATDNVDRTEKGTGRIHIDSRDVMKHIRKDAVPATKVHTPKNAYRRSRFDWREVVDSLEDDLDDLDFDSSCQPSDLRNTKNSSSSSDSHI